jgi:hypothetical protein
MKSLIQHIVELFFNRQEKLKLISQTNVKNQLFVIIYQITRPQINNSASSFEDNIGLYD